MVIPAKISNTIRVTAKAIRVIPVFYCFSYNNPFCLLSDSPLFFSFFTKLLLTFPICIFISSFFIFSIQKADYFLFILLFSLILINDSLSFFRFCFLYKVIYMCVYIYSLKAYSLFHLLCTPFLFSIIYSSLFK